MMTSTQKRAVFVVRHGARQDVVDPAWLDTAERPYDPGLAPEGLVQARELAQRMARESIAHVVCSPYLRAVQTAHPSAEALGVPLLIEPGVGEILRADWFPSAPEPLPLAELARRFPRIDPSHVPLIVPRYPETEDQALARAGETARRLVDAIPGDLLIVGHGTSVQGVVWGLIPDHPPVKHVLCAIYKLVGSAGQFSLELDCDTSHLGTAPGE